MKFFYVLLFVSDALFVLCNYVIIFFILFVFYLYICTCFYFFFTFIFFLLYVRSGQEHKAYIKRRLTVLFLKDSTTGSSKNQATQRTLYCLLRHCVHVSATEDCGCVRVGFTVLYIESSTNYWTLLCWFASPTPIAPRILTRFCPSCVCVIVLFLTFTLFTFFFT